MNSEMLTGWVFSDSTAIEWQTIARGLSKKPLATAGGQLMALYKLEPNTIGPQHEHKGAEFTYLLEGDLSANGIKLKLREGYGAQAGTRHDEFSTEGGCVFLSITLDLASAPR